MFSWRELVPFIIGVDNFRCWDVFVMRSVATGESYLDRKVPTKNLTCNRSLLLFLCVSCARLMHCRRHHKCIYISIFTPGAPNNSDTFWFMNFFDVFAGFDDIKSVDAGKYQNTTVFCLHTNIKSVISLFAFSICPSFHSAVFKVFVIVPVFFHRLIWIGRIQSMVLFNVSRW